MYSFFRKSKLSDEHPLKQIKSSFGEMYVFGFISLSKQLAIVGSAFKQRLSNSFLLSISKYPKHRRRNIGR